MVWVLVFSGIALAGLAMVVSYGVWLAHKAADLFAELGVVLERLGQLGDILGEIRLPLPGDEADLAPPGGAPARPADSGGGGGIPQREPLRIGGEHVR